MNAAVGGNTVAYSLTDTLGCTGVDSIWWSSWMPRRWCSG